mmetsp:Transcript_92828/g.276942  ORF Transcript_92828/g.276942 Transcript_92828/m.276942 type:complete len:266 (+) Transcript_92828:1300-2097(+)
MPLSRHSRCHSPHLCHPRAWLETTPWCGGWPSPSLPVSARTSPCAWRTPLRLPLGQSLPGHRCPRLCPHQASLRAPRCVGGRPHRAAPSSSLLRTQRHRRRARWSKQAAYVCHWPLARRRHPVRPQSTQRHLGAHVHQSQRALAYGARMSPCVWRMPAVGPWLCRHHSLRPASRAAPLCGAGRVRVEEHPGASNSSSMSPWPPSGWLKRRPVCRQGRRPRASPPGVGSSAPMAAPASVMARAWWRPSPRRCGVRRRSAQGRRAGA